jgi:hypothetical protein
VNTTPESEADPRLPGRLVVVALVCLYVWGISWLCGLGGLANLAFAAVPILILAAIIIRLSEKPARRMTNQGEQ